MSVEMSGHQFRQWRKKLGLSQKGAAKALGLKTRMVQYYEKGERGGKNVEVPLSVRLACWSLQNGVADFDGSATVALALPARGQGDKAKRAAAAKPGRAASDS